MNKPNSHVVQRQTRCIAKNVRWISENKFRYSFSLKIELIELRIDNKWKTEFLRNFVESITIISYSNSLKQCVWNYFLHVVRPFSTFLTGNDFEMSLKLYSTSYFGVLLFYVLNKIFVSNKEALSACRMQIQYSNSKELCWSNHQRGSVELNFLSFRWKFEVRVPQFYF